MYKQTDARQTQRGKRVGVLIVLLIFILLLTAGYISAKAYIDNNVEIDTFYPGVSVDGVLLEGMTKQEAFDEVSSINLPRLEQYKVQLTSKDKTWTYDYGDIHAKVNIENVLEEAYQLGRQGSLLDRVKKLRDLEKNPVNLTTKLSISPEELKDEVEEIAAAISKPAADAAIAFYPEREDKFSITPEETGYELDVDEVLAQIQRKLEEEPSIEVELQINRIEPKTLSKDLEKQTHKIASFSTVVEGSENRKHNVYLSTQQFNGMIIKPGQIVSFNQTTGQRTLENGYKAAPVIKADKSLEDDLGGGVCQTSSTLYNAVLYAGLDIVERIHHSFPSTYVDKGLDATVNWPNLDLKFKNSRQTPVYMVSYKKGNEIFFEIYGEELSNNQEVKLETDVYQTYAAPKPKTEEDTKGVFVTYNDQTHEKVKSRPGYKVKSYRIFYEDGKEVSRELLANDFYKPIIGLIHKGIKDRPVFGK